MGLDMNLMAEKTYYGFMPEHKSIVDSIRKVIPDNDVELDGVTLTTEAIYWRKANHIHKWFVDNVQNGVDDCGRYYVKLDKLQELRDICGKILDDPTKSSTLLPTQGGFFFGNTDYDDYYRENIEETVDKLDEWIKRAETGDYNFYYQSSW